jgi:hypothetical protein
MLTLTAMAAEAAPFLDDKVLDARRVRFTIADAPSTDGRAPQG